MWRRAPAVLALAWLPACGPAEGEATFAPAQAATTPIYEGQPAPDDDAVVALVDARGAVFCSGTLITPAVVLTAAHCLEGVTLEDGLHVFFGEDTALGGESRAAARIATHPDYSAWELTADVGLVELAAPAPAGVQPVAYLPRSLALGAADAGSEIRFVGYGFSEDGGYGRRLQVSGRIGVVCAGPRYCTYEGEDVVPHAFAYRQVEGGPCQGDSGGPALLSRAGREYVAGVTSYGSPSCYRGGVSTMAGDYAAIIEAFIAGEALEPVAAVTRDCPACAGGEERSRGGCAAVAPTLLAPLAWPLWLRRRRRSQKVQPP